MPTAPAATPATIPVRFSARGAIRRSIPLRRPGHPATPPLHLHQSILTRCRCAGTRAPMPVTISYAMVPRRSRPLGGGDLLVALAADEHDLVADLDGDVAEVDQQLVHRDHADDRAAPAADQHLAAGEAEVAGHAVGVARGHGRDPSRRARPPTAGRRTRVRPAASVFTMRDRGPAATARAAARPGVVGERGRGREAVAGDADAHEVVARAAGTVEQARRVRRVHERRAEPARRRARRAPRRSGASCSAVYGFSGSSATARCVHTPASASSSRAATCAASATASSGVQPTRCMPVSTLRCTASGSARPASATALASASMPGSVYTTGVSRARRRGRRPAAPAPTGA